MSAAFQRRIYSDRDAIVPEIPVLGWSRQHAARQSFSAHSHHRIMEICLIAKGSVEWWAGERVYDVSRSNVYITYPDEKHGAVGEMLQPCELYWLQLSVRDPMRLPGLSQEAAQRLVNDFQNLLLRTFPVRRMTQQAMIRILDEHHTPGQHPQAVVRGSLLTLLTGILEDAAHWQSKKHNQTPSKPIANILKQITQNPVLPLDINAMAKESDLGVSQFQTRFKREVGMPIGQYRAKVRNHLARQRLRDAKLSITDIAMQLGFASSQHFATHFKQLNGQTPNQFRQQQSLSKIAR